MPFSALVAFAVAMLSAVFAYNCGGAASLFALLLLIVSAAFFVASLSNRRIRRPCV